MKIKKNIAISDSGFLFNPLSGESFSLNPIGVEIFNLVKEEKSFNDLKSSILQKYRIDEITFEKDYSDFVGLLKHFQILEEHED